MLPRHKGELPEDEYFQTMAQMALQSLMHPVLEEFKPQDGHLLGHPVSPTMLDSTTNQSRPTLHISGAGNGRQRPEKEEGSEEWPDQNQRKAFGSDHRRTKADSLSLPHQGLAVTPLPLFVA